MPGNNINIGFRVQALNELEFGKMAWESLEFENDNMTISLI